MNEDITQEIDFNSVDEVSNVSDLDYTEQEIESVVEDSQVELISTLLHLLEEEKAKEEESLLSDDLLSDDSIEPVPVLVQSVDVSPDYTDILNSLDSRLENVESLLLDSSQPRTLDTPLNEYPLESFLLVFVLVLLGVSLGYQFLKDNFLHL